MFKDRCQRKGGGGSGMRTEAGIPEALLVERSRAFSGYTLNVNKYVMCTGAVKIQLKCL